MVNNKKLWVIILVKHRWGVDRTMMKNWKMKT